jgi:hypothetical protein
MATSKTNAAEEAAKKAAEAAAATQNNATETPAAPAAVATTPATPAPAEPAKKAPFYKRPGFWLGVTGVVAIATAFGAGYKKGKKDGREAALAEEEEDKIANAIGAGIASANDHNSDRGGNTTSTNSGSRDTNRR